MVAYLLGYHIVPMVAYLLGYFLMVAYFCYCYGSIFMNNLFYFSLINESGVMTTEVITSLFLQTWPM